MLTKCNVIFATAWLSLDMMTSASDLGHAQSRRAIQPNCRQGALLIVGLALAITDTVAMWRNANSFKCSGGPHEFPSASRPRRGQAHRR